MLKTKRIYFSVLFLSFLVGLGTLITAEYFFLPYWKGLPRDVLLMGFAAKPGSLIDETPINAMGFTGDSIALTKTPGTIRILTLGGSSMFNKRMTERLKQGLTKVSRRPIEILGAALRTHTTRSSAVKYKLLRKYRFDFVLIYHGINDLWTNHIPIEGFQSDYSHLGSWYTRTAWLDNCLICRTVYNKWLYQGPARSSSGNLSGFASEVTFKQNILTLIQDIRRDDSTPILMTFAWTIPANYTQAVFEDHSLGYNNPTNYDRWPVELWGSPNYVREGLKRNNKILMGVASSKDILLLDQEKLMGKELRWYGDVCHFSDEGTDKFIENISDFFIQQGLLL